MKIYSIDEANETIDALVEWLQNYREPFPEHDYHCENEDHSAQLAREWSSELLRASTANGLGGCKLCQG